MFAALDDFAIFDDQHLVGVADGGQAVGDHKTGAALHQLEQRFLDARLGARVHAGGRLVQNQNARVGQNRARNRQHLALALAQVGGALREHRPVAVRQLADEVVSIGHARGLHHLVVARVQPPVADILHDRIGKHERILQNQPQRAAQVGAADVAQVVPINADRAAVDVVKARQQVGDGCLSRPGRADERNRLAGQGLQRHVFDDGMSRFVGEIHSLEFDVTLEICQTHRPVAVYRFGGRVNHLEDPLRTRQSSLDGVIDIGELAQGRDESVGVADKGGDNAHGHESAQGQPSAQSCQNDDKQIAKLVGERHQHHGVGVGKDARLEHIRVDPAEVLHRCFVAPKSLDHALPADGLLHHAVQLAQAFLQVAEAFAGRLGDEVGEPDHDRHDDNRGQRQPEVEHEHRHHEPDQREHAAEHGDDILRDGLVDGIDVISQATHQLPGVVRVKKLEREFLQVREQVAAQVFERVLRNPRHRPRRERLERLVGDVNHQQGDRHLGQPGELFVPDILVDCPPHQVRAEQIQPGGDENQDQHQGDGCPVMAEIRDQPGQRLARVGCFFNFGGAHRAASGQRGAGGLLLGGCLVGHLFSICHCEPHAFAAQQSPLAWENLVKRVFLTFGRLLRAIALARTSLIYPAP